MYTLKAGDTLSACLRIIDVTDRDVADLTNISFKSQIRDSYGKLLANVNISIGNQTSDDKGFVFLSVPANVTKNWEECDAQMDIKLISGDSVISTRTINFNIIESPTEY